VVGENMEYIETVLDKLTQSGLITNPAQREIAREALADYAFCASIDSDIRKEANRIAGIYQDED
jgi:hypothetical protein